MPTFVLSARVGERLEAALLRNDVQAVADAFAEMYVLANAGCDEGMAADVDTLALAALK